MKWCSNITGFNRLRDNFHALNFTHHKNNIYVSSSHSQRGTFLVVSWGSQNAQLADVFFQTLNWSGSTMQWRPQVFLSFASKFFFQQMKQMESKVIWTNLKMTPKYLEKIPIFLEISSWILLKNTVGLQRLDGQTKVIKSKKPFWTLNDDHVESPRGKDRDSGVEEPHRVNP